VDHLRTVPLSGGEWFALTAAVLWPILVMEAVKSWGRGASGGMLAPQGGRRI